MKPHQQSGDVRTRRITDCKAAEDYRLWLRFDDDLEGSVFLGDLLEISAFRQWRDVSKCCGAMIDPAAATVCWEGGIRFDPDVLYRDLLSSRAGKEFGVPGLAPAVE